MNDIQNGLRRTLRLMDINGTTLEKLQDLIRKAQSDGIDLEFCKGRILALFFKFHPGLATCWTFPNGFQKQADQCYGWCRHYGLTPTWGPFICGEARILLPESQIEYARKLIR